MNFQLDEAIEILARTPGTVTTLLLGLSDKWVQAREGEGTWNSFEVIGHLIEAEKTNWIPRLQFILDGHSNQSFPPFDRFSHLNGLTETNMEQRLTQFKELRNENISKLKILAISEEKYELTGIHPEFGAVKLSEMLSTWVVHDLTHISQIVRVMAERYRNDVGPWKEYLSILKKSSLK